ncbi:hypothetical protein TM5383_00227 [Thalassovita mediterranea]|uniref:Uncharacterized protein n=1 Tax=Thalassovita mediterranea TaxID=340021 RepID=A0A0P1H052_9RHOB|nr:hypothetical protein TM5383_00227 [Thalassovita mediterranea]SIS31193.1 hypothetical protein SAMN05421685_10445 [Thalassovita mediterranea]
MTSLFQKYPRGTARMDRGADSPRPARQTNIHLEQET